METKTQDTIAYDASSAIVLAGKAQSALASANDFVIDSHTMFELASDDLKQVKALQKEVEEKRTSITGPLNQAVKAVNDLFRAPKDYLDKAEATLKRAMVTWTTEQERLAAIARAEAEAAARAERERLRVERLQDISPADCEEEGVQQLPLQEDAPNPWYTADIEAGSVLHSRSAIGAYHKLWEAINRPGSWDANPWVWVVEFKRLEAA